MFVTFLYLIIRAVNLLIVVIIMQTYNIGYIIISCVGFGIGHLIFGLIRDSIVIRKIKKERKEMKERKNIQMAELLSRRKTTMETERF